MEDDKDDLMQEERMKDIGKSIIVSLAFLGCVIVLCAIAYYLKG